MMMKLISVFVLGLGFAACAADDGDGVGSGDDVLPKRGEMATDPTIVSATASMESSYAWLRVSASDPKGTSNLATCAFVIDGVMHQGYFSDGYERCSNELETPWPVGTAHTVKIIVSNATGGFTTASVDLLMGTGSGSAN